MVEMYSPYIQESCTIHTYSNTPDVSCGVELEVAGTGPKVPAGSDCTVIADGCQMARLWITFDNGTQASASQS